MYFGLYLFCFLHNVQGLGLLSSTSILFVCIFQYAPAESLSELGQQVLSSPAKNYLLGVLMTIIGIIFIVGITCGRVTKRVTREQKTK